MRYALIVKRRTVYDAEVAFAAGFKKYLSIGRSDRSGPVFSMVSTA